MSVLYLLTEAAVQMWLCLYYIKFLFQVKIEWAGNSLNHITRLYWNHTSQALIRILYMTNYTICAMTFFYWGLPDTFLFSYTFNIIILIHIGILLTWWKWQKSPPAMEQSICISRIYWNNLQYKNYVWMQIQCNKVIPNDSIIKIKRREASRAL